MKSLTDTILKYDAFFEEAEEGGFLWVCRAFLGVSLKEIRLRRAGAAVTMAIFRITHWQYIQILY